MKIKLKLTLALGTLFLMITLLSALAIRQMHLLEQDTKNILQANYKSLDYSRNMYKAIGSEILNEPDIEKFKYFLLKQQSNITEVGEKELTDDLALGFKTLEQNPSVRESREKVRGKLNEIMKLNMDAIQRKSIFAGKTAENAVLWITFTAALCILLGFTLLINLPDAIAGPIKKLTESIKQIGDKNYAQRVYIKGHDEFASMAKTFNTMAQKLEEYFATDLSKLMMEKKRIETLIDTMADPVIGLNENYDVLFANDGALHITGLKKAALLGKNIKEIALTNDLVRSLSKDIILGSPAKNETLKIFANNRESYFEKDIVPITVIPTGEAEGVYVGSVIILRNITAHKELDEAKTNFIATVSHEFKTPIASMKMSLQLLENEKTGALNEEQAGLVTGLKDDAERLLRTTGELLNITQLETGQSGLKPEALSITGVIATAVAATQKLAHQKSIHVTLATDNIALPEVFADKEKATWILSNLLSNAIRYSYDDGTVEINSNITYTHVEIAVTDHGAGIDPHYQQKVFDKYFRVPGTEKEGTGLGLTISKAFLEAMGGYITLSSEFGRGSTFTAAFKRNA